MSTTTCSCCTWRLPDSMVPGGLEEVRQTLAVVHVLVRHPETYHEVTGVTPEKGREMYAEVLANDLCMVLV